MGQPILLDKVAFLMYNPTTNHGKEDLKMYVAPEMEVIRLDVANNVCSEEFIEMEGSWFGDNLW